MLPSTPTSTPTPLPPKTSSPDLGSMRIIVLDDHRADLLLIERSLMHAGFKHITVFEDPRNALDYLKEHSADLLLTDIKMPHLNGLQVMAEIEKVLPEAKRFPVVLLTNDERRETRQTALALGASSVIAKPFDALELSLVVKNLLKTRQARMKLEQTNQDLLKRTLEQEIDLSRSHADALTRLALAAEFRDTAAREHIWRVAETSRRLALELGWDKNEAEDLLRAARMHDVGKVAITDEILYKPGPLTQEEYETVKTHTTVGAQLLMGTSDLVVLARTVALTHHERWDGSGYPNGLKAEEIPAEGRIVAVADAFDIMTHDQAHRVARSLTEAVEEVIAQSGKQFAPEVVDAFCALYKRGEVPVIL